MRTIRTISLHQPWASAMAFGLKKNETRHWPTDFRGPLAIHAAKTKEYLRYYFKTGWQPGGIGATIVDALKGKSLLGIEGFPLGAIVGVTNVIDCVPVEKIRAQLGRVEEVFGGYDDGRFAWITDGMIPLSIPIQERGHQGFWNWMPPAGFELGYRDALPFGRWERF